MENINVDDLQWLEWKYVLTHERFLESRKKYSTTDRAGRPRLNTCL